MHRRSEDSELGITAYMPDRDLIPFVHPVNVLVVPILIFHGRSNFSGRPLSGIAPCVTNQIARVC